MLAVLGASLCLGCSFLPMEGGSTLPDIFPLGEDFEAAQVQSFWHSELADASRASLGVPGTANPAGGSQAALVTVKPEDTASFGNRAELAIYNCAAYTDTVYYRFDFCIPSGDPQDYQWQVLAQWYQLPDFARGETFSYQYPHPPVALVLVPGTLEVKVSTGSERTVLSAPISTGTWYRVAVGLHFDTGDQGWLQVWFGTPGGTLNDLGGKLMLPTLFNKAGAYFKAGLYRGVPGQTQAPSTNQIWLDNFVLSRDIGEAVQ